MQEKRMVSNSIIAIKRGLAREWLALTRELRRFPGLEDELRQVNWEVGTHYVKLPILHRFSPENVSVPANTLQFETLLFPTRCKELLDLL